MVIKNNIVIKLLFSFSLPAVLLFVGCSSEKPVKQSPAPVVQPKVTSAADAEYNRSTAGVSVTKAQFNADKSEILQIIERLSVIMADYDYHSWLSYVDPDSVSYWSNPKNLKALSGRLPGKPRLSSLNDYFKFMFVPSRRGRSIDEIRYLSEDRVRAVQIKDGTEVVYYNFIKTNSKWMVNLPQL